MTYIKKSILLLLLTVFSVISTAGAFAVTLTVSPPVMQNGTKDDAWIPIFFQGQLSADFQNNSDFGVIDRTAAFQIAGEQQVREAAASMTNEDAGIRYAQLLAADYSVSVTIVNKGGSYSLDCKVI